MPNLLPHIDIHFPGTPRLMAKLIFRTNLDQVRFKTKAASPLEVLPLSFIYLGHLYWPKGKPFLFNNEVMKYSPKEILCLEQNEFRQLYKDILIHCNIIKQYPDEPEKSIQSNHLIDVMGYAIQNFFADGSPLKLRKTENKIIDQLNIPALENSLNEAVRIENYEAAAYIKKRIEAKGHIVFENQGRLKIRRRAPLAEIKIRH